MIISDIIFKILCYKLFIENFCDGIIVFVFELLRFFFVLVVVNCLFDVFVKEYFILFLEKISVLFVSWEIW